MSKIEDLIVSMKFDNKQFEAGVKVSMMTLNALKSSLNFGGASKGLDEVQASANRFSLAGMGSAVEGISGKFMALSTVAVTALSNITNRAVDAGIALGKSLTVDPIMQGFSEYELKLNSIQTIMSGSGASLEVVNQKLADLNAYSDRTIYSFADMTENIGKFTNAGVSLDDSVSAIQGVANVAAVSGANSNEASRAMYNFAQALSKGHVQLVDWKSIELANMGTVEFKQQLIDAAVAAGTLTKGVDGMYTTMSGTALSATQGFNDSLQDQWMTTEVLTKTLGDYADETTNIGKKAFAAAQDVKSFSQLMDTMKESVGSGWAETFEVIVGDFEEAKTLWTQVNKVFGEAVGKASDARNELLRGWSDLGGRDALIAGLGNVFKALFAIVKPLGQAFRDIFPASTAAQLANLTTSFKNFTQGLIVGSETADKLRRTFAGVFAIFGIGWEIVKGLFSGFMQLFGGIQSGAGGFLSLTAAIGDWLVAAHSAIKNGDGLSSIFGALGTILTIPIKLFSGMASVLGGLITGLGQLGSTARMVFDILATGDFRGGPFDEDSAVVDTLFKIREALVSVGSAVEQFWNILAKGDFVSGVFSEDSPIVDGLFKIREALSGFFEPGNLSMLLGAGAAGGLGLAIRKVLKDGINIGVAGSEGLFDKLKGVFDSISGTFDGVTELFGSLTGALTTMQNNIKANIILKIAAAVGVLAVSMKLLSTIDAGDLGKALGAITAAMTQLLGAMAILAKVAGGAGFLAIPSLATAMVSLSVAVLILSTAVKSLSELSWEELAKGLVGVGGALAIVVAGAMGLSKVQGSIMRTAVALIPLAVSLKILASAVKDFAGMSWAEMGQGLVGIGGALVVIGGALRVMPDTMMSTGAGLILVGAGLKIVASAVGNFANMSWGDMAQGLVGLGGSLLIMAGALRLMPPNMATMGLGLTLVSVGIAGISAAVQVMGGMGWEELAKGLVGLGGALGILAVALTFMSSTLAGSAALILAAGAISMLVPSILMLSALSWADLIQGLVGLAGTLTVLGVAGMLLTPVVPTLLALGAALALLGVGLGSIGLGAQAFATAMTMFVTLVDKSKASLIGLMDLIPLMAAKLAEGIIAFATTISANAATFVGAFKNLILALLDAIIEISPRIGEALTVLLQTFLHIIIVNTPGIAQAFTTIIQTFLQTLATNVPLIVSTIMDMMIQILNAIAARMPDLVTAGVNVIVSFIQGVTDNLPRITDAGANLIITFVNSLANTINARSGEMRAAGGRLAFAIVDGMTFGLLSKVQSVANAAAELGRKAIAAAKNAIDSNSPSKEFIKIGQFAGDGFVIGMDDSQNVVSKAAAGMGEAALYGTREGLTGVEKLFDDVGRAAQETFNILAYRDYKGVAWQEDSPIVGQLLDLRDGFTSVGRAADETFGILTTGDFRGKIWEEGSPIVNTLFDIRKGFLDVAKTGQSAADILTKSDYTGGLWAEDSPIVDGLFKIREAFGPSAVEEFQNVGNNIVEGFILGVESGQNAFHNAIADMSNGALQTARDVLGIKSPSREFEKIGEYSADGIVKGTSNKTPEVKKAGANLATNLMMGFTTGVGKEMPKALDSIFKTLESGTADVKFWGPNSPATMQLMGMHGALKEVNLQMAEFYGEVNRADPESMAAYTEKVGDNLTHLTDLFAGLKEAAGTAFGMLADGKGLDQVLGSTDVLSQILGAVLTLLPGVQGAAISIGLAIVDGLLSTFMGPGTTVLGIIGDFLGDAVRWIGGLFGIKFPPIEEEVKKGEEAVEDFLVTVEDGHGRFQKLTEEGIAALTDTLSNVDDLLKMDTNPKITPVLDLTQFNKDHTKMLSTLEPPVDISMNTSNAQASGVFAMQQELKNAQSDVEPVAPVTNIELKQYNSSPKALSNVEIYRQTKSQLSLAREALKV